MIHLKINMVSNLKQLSNENPLVSPVSRTPVTILNIITDDKVKTIKKPKLTSNSSLDFKIQ